MSRNHVWFCGFLSWGWSYHPSSGGKCRINLRPTEHLVVMSLPGRGTVWGNIAVGVVGRPLVVVLEWQTSAPLSAELSAARGQIQPTPS